MSAEFHIHVSYAQIAIFESQLENPFSDWTEENVRQGFVWRQGSVSFRTLVEDAEHFVRVVVADHFESIDPRAIRVIEVPFEVPPSGDIEVAGIMGGTLLSLNAGKYQLRAEFLVGGNCAQFEVLFSFARTQTDRFAVLKRDSELDPPEKLVVGGRAAA